MTHTTVAQNAAHRADLTWIKIGPSQYMRSDGTTISKSNMTCMWTIYLPSGEPASRPNYDVLLATEYSLTEAKRTAREVDASTPPYVSRVRRARM